MQHRDVRLLGFLVSTACVFLTPVSAAEQAEQAFQAGLALFQSGNRSGALEAFRRATNLDAKQARYWKAIGVVYASLSEFSQADVPFAQACRLEPRLQDACYYYGRNLYMLDRFEASVAALQKAVDSGSKRWRTHIALGQAYEALGRTREAAEHYSRAVKAEERATMTDQAGDDEIPHVALGTFLFRQGDVPGARSALEFGVARHPTSATANFELGRVLNHVNELEGASLHVSRAIQGGYGPAAHLLLGKIYLRLGKKNEAEMHFKAGRALAP